MHKSVQSSEKHRSDPALSNDRPLKQRLGSEGRSSDYTVDIRPSKVWKGLNEEEGGPLFVHQGSNFQEDTSSHRESSKLASTFGRISKIEEPSVFKPALSNVPRPTSAIAMVDELTPRELA